MYFLLSQVDIERGQTGDVVEIFKKNIKILKNDLALKKTLQAKQMLFLLRNTTNSLFCFSAITIHKSNKI